MFSLYPDHTAGLNHLAEPCHSEHVGRIRVVERSLDKERFSAL